MKKILSVLLALCLLVGAVPMFASAADGVVVNHFCNTCGKIRLDCSLEFIRYARVSQWCYAPLRGDAIDTASRIRF